MTDQAPLEEDVADQVRREVERAIQRNIKGLEFLTAPKQRVGAMAREELIRRGTFSLYHYRAVESEVYRTPVLIVSPPSNRGYIFDLAPQQSFVEFLLGQGFDIFMIDWNPPRNNEKHLKIEDYVFDFITESVAKVEAITGQSQVSLLGYCMGGTLALIYAALDGGTHVRNLVLFTTPVDFTGMTLFKNWANPDYFDVDDVVDRIGNIPPDMILSAFDMMRPANRTAGVLHLWTNMLDDNYVRSYRMFDRWAAETLALPGEFFRQIVKDLMWANALCKNELVIGGRKVDLRDIKVPTISVIAQHDHVVPFPVAHPIMELIASTDKEEIVTKGGHVSVVSGPGAVKRVWPSINNWLGERSC